jgi:transposase
MGYSSDLSDSEWEVISKYLPLEHKTRKTEHPYRAIFNGILYQLKNGCRWRDLPKDLPPYSTVYWHYKKLNKSGALNRANKKLLALARDKVEKKEPTVVIADSQAVKNTSCASVESKGFCSYKCTNGIKRHLVVDTLGLIVFSCCTPGNVSDNDGLVQTLIDNREYFETRDSSLTKLNILLDNGYSVDKIHEKLKGHKKILNKINLSIVPKMSKDIKKEKNVKVLYQYLKDGL